MAGEPINEQEIEDFVAFEAMKLVKVAARIVDPNNSLGILINVCGYEKIIMALREYEENEFPKKVG
jgi:hypothetical protein